MCIDTAILVGGRAKRMGGAPKGLMVRNEQTVLGRTVALCQPHEVFLVGDPKGPYARMGLDIYPDIIPERGAPGGVLTAISRSQTEWVRVIACDLPDLTPAIISDLVPSAEHQVVLYRVGGQPQYLVSLWHQSCEITLREIIEKSSPGFQQILEHFAVDWLAHADIDGFANMNDPDDARRLGVVQQRAGD